MKQTIHCSKNLCDNFPPEDLIGEDYRITYIHPSIGMNEARRMVYNDEPVSKQKKQVTTAIKRTISALNKWRRKKF